MPTDMTVPEIWAKTVDQVKLLVNHRSLWESLEKTFGIAIEDGILIVGMNSRHLGESGHMLTSEHRNAIETTASSIAGQPLRIRIIEGETEADWAATKLRDERVAAMRSATYQKKDKESGATETWDAVYDLVAKSWSGLHGRQLPQVRSKYISAMVAAVVDAMEKIPPSDSDEHSQRLIARVIDRIAGNVEAPSALIALEIDRARAH